MGKSFGQSHEIHKKCLMPNINPGPGEYKVLKKFGSDKPSIKFKG